MLVYCVDVFVQAGHEADFAAASRENHRQTRKEPGNLRFDVLQESNDPGHFILYEAYASEEAVKKHKESDHYLKWRETVEPWMAQKRQGREYSVICPQEESRW